MRLRPELLVRRVSQHRRYLMPHQQEGEGPEISPEEPRVVRRPFNPMATYVQMVVLIIVGYGLLSIFGYPVLIMAMLVVIIMLVRETLYVLAHLPFRFVTAAAYANMAYSAVGFVTLVVNAFAITQTGQPAILPEVPSLTLICPLFIMAALLGTVNLRKMFEPVSQER